MELHIGNYVATANSAVFFRRLMKGGNKRVIPYHVDLLLHTYVVHYYYYLIKL